VEINFVPNTIYESREYLNCSLETCSACRKRIRDTKERAH